LHHINAEGYDSLREVAGNEGSTTWKDGISASANFVGASLYFQTNVQDTPNNP
jgi:hypothetical protein